MKKVTIEQIIAWEPCGLHGGDDGTNYTPQRIECLFAGREALTARDIATLDIPAADKLWALLHPEFVTDAQMHEAACHYAEAVVHLCGDNPRLQAAIDAKRAWLRGEISDHELAAARAAALAAAWDVAGAAAWAAAWDAAWADQVAYLVAVIEEATER